MEALDPFRVVLLPFAKFVSRRRVGYELPQLERGLSIWFSGWDELCGDIAGLELPCSDPGLSCMESC